MKKINLSDVCEISAGQSAPQKTEYFSKDGYPFVRAGSLEKLIVGNEELEHINDSIGKKLRLRLFPQNTILFAKSGMSAKIGRVFKLQSSSFVVSHLAAIIPDLKKIEPNWLKRWFEFNPPSRLIPNDAYPSIKLSEIARLKIPVVALEKQKQASTVLDTADTLRQKRKEQFNLLDDYLKSVFFEMFGDPIQNDKSWEIYKFGDVCPTRLGKMLDAKKQTGRNPKQYLRNQNILWGKFNLNELAVMDFDLREQKEFRLIKGDVLICEGGEVGRTAIWNEDMTECYFQKALHRGRPNIKRILPIYILHLMWMYSKYGGFKDYVSSVTIAHLTGEKLKSMTIPVPPIKLQNKFVSIVEQVEQTKQKMLASLDEMDNHFNALMQRYFG